VALMFSAMPVAALLNNQVSATMLMAPRPSITSSCGQCRSATLLMQMGYNSFNDNSFDWEPPDWEPPNAFDMGGSPPWMHNQPPPFGMPVMGGAPPWMQMGEYPPPWMHRPPPYDMPEMNARPGHYHQPPPPQGQSRGPPPGARQGHFRGPSSQGQFRGPSSRPPSELPIREAWVLIVNVGQDLEGPCALNPRPGSGRAPAFLAFEDTHDAEQFAKILFAEEPNIGRAQTEHWQADQLQSFIQQSGMEMMIVPRGELPPSPSMGRNQGGDLERRYPGDGTMQPDAYSSTRPQLEALLRVEPDNCSDDDCTVPEPDASHGASKPHDRLKMEALAAIDAILATSKSTTMDLTKLMESVWQKVKADRLEKDSDGDEKEGGQHKY